MCHIRVQRSDDKFSERLEKAVAIGAELDVELRKPRAATILSRYKSMQEGIDDSASYYRRNIYLPSY